MLAIQKLKNSFVCNLWGWAKLYIGEKSLSLIGFLEWLAIQLRVGEFFLFFFFGCEALAA